MSYQAAVDSLGKMTRVLKAFEDADVVLKAMAGLEQNERELRAAADKWRAEANLAQTDAADAKEAVKKARLEVKKIDAAAQQTAEQIVGEAQARAEQMRAESTASLDEARSTLRAIHADIEKAVADQKAAQAELDRVRNALTDARQRVATMLG